MRDIESVKMDSAAQANWPNDSEKNNKLTTVIMPQTPCNCCICKNTPLVTRDVNMRESEGNEICTKWE